MQPAVLSSSGGRAASPLLYGAGLATYFDPTLDVLTTGSDVDSIENQAGGALLTVPGGSTEPELIASSHNGQPGIRFSAQAQRLQSAAGAFMNNLWAGAGLKRIVWGVKPILLTNDEPALISTQLVMFDKGLAIAGDAGWQLRLQPGTGRAEFICEYTGNQRFSVLTGPVAAAGSLFMGWLDWDGDREGVNFAFRIWNGSAFVGVPVTIGKPVIGSVLADDTGRAFAIGNNTTGAFNANFEGDFLMFYATKPKNGSQDPRFLLSRFIP